MKRRVSCQTEQPNSSRRLRLAWFAALFVFVFSAAAVASTSGITYQGRILKPDGSPLAGEFTQFKLQIRTPDAAACLMYEEVQSQDLRNKNGNFSLTINDGSGSRIDTSGLSLDRIFANRGSFTLDPTTCSAGAGTYAPNTSDGRNLVVLFKDESMTTWEPIPAQKINFVPLAFEAKQVAGFTADSLLRVVNGSGDPLTGLAPLSNAQYTELMALVNGTSTAFTKANQLGGVALPSMTSGEVLGWNGSAWVSQAAVAGPNSVTTTMLQASAVDSSKIATGAVTGAKLDPAIAISTSGTIASAISTTRDFKIFAASPSAYYVGMAAPALTASYTLTWPLTAGSANQVLTTDGAGALSWTTPTSNGFAQGGNTFGATANLGTNDAFDLNFRTNGATAMTITSGGAVGIGTTSPTFLLNLTATDPSLYVSSSSSLKTPITSAGAALEISNKSATQGSASYLQFRTQNTTTSSQTYIGAVSTVGYGSDLVFGARTGSNSYSERLRIAGNTGYVGIGTTSPTAPLSVTSSTAVIGGSNFHAFNSYAVANATASGGNYWAQKNAAAYTGVGNLTSQLVSGEFEATRNDPAAGTAARLLGAVGTARNDAAGTTTDATGVYGYARATAGTITNGYGGKFDVTASSGTITNGYGLYIGNVQATTKYSLYSSDATAANYFAGKVGIGTNAPSAKLTLAAGSATAGTSPLKFTTGPVMTTPEDGALEYDGTGLWFTIGTTRYVIPTNTASGNYSNVSTISNSGGSITMTPAAGNSVIVNQSTVSTSSSTGALIVNGGVGIVGAINADGNIFSGGSITATTNGVIPQLYGSTAANGNIKIDGTSNAAPGNILLATTGGKVGIGTTSPDAVVTIHPPAVVDPSTPVSGIASYIETKNSTAGTATIKGAEFYATTYQPSGANGSLIGSLSRAFNATTGTTTDVIGADNSAAGSWTGTTTNMIGTRSDALAGWAGGTFTNVTGTYGHGSVALGTVTNVYGGNFLAEAIVGGVTIPNAYGNRSEVKSASSSTITNGYGVYAAVTPNSGTITNRYGVYIADSGTGANFYNLYSAGTGKNYFAGSVGIGTSSPAGILDVQGGTAAAGANGSGINIVAQNGGTGTTAGGSILIQAGKASGTGAAGSVSIVGGANGSSNIPGSVSIRGGTATSAAGANATIGGSNGSGSGNGGGATNILSGNGGTNADGGGIFMTSGGGNGTGGSGPILISTGAGGSTGNAANLSIKTGNGGLTSGNAGHIYLDPGTATSGTNGNVYIASASGNVGIGTTSATNRLTVSGNANVTGTFTANYVFGTNIASFRTIGSSGGTAGYWTRILNLQFSQRYQYYSGTFEVNSGSAFARGVNARIFVRVKQDNPMGGAPLVSVEVDSSSTVLKTTDVVAVTTVNSASQTEVGLYVRLNTDYDSLTYSPVTSGNWSDVLDLAPTALAAALPAGTQTPAIVGLSKWDLGAVTNSIAYTGGYVGIGTTSPTVALDVSGAISSSATVTGAYFTATDSGSTDVASVTLNNTNNAGTSSLFFKAGGINKSFIRSGFTAATTDAYLAMSVRGSGTVSERMRIDSTGNVGIGTTAPQATLDIAGDIRLKKNTSAPVACSAAYDGRVALTSQYKFCVCNGGSSSWVSTVDGTTACSW